MWTNDDPEVLGLIEAPGEGLVSTPGFRSACLAVATPEALILQGQTRMNVVAVSAGLLLGAVIERGPAEPGKEREKIENT